MRKLFSRRQKDAHGNKSENIAASNTSEASDLTSAEAPMPGAVRDLIPEDERGGPSIILEDGRRLIIGRRILMITDDVSILDSGFWHEIQYASWDAGTRLLKLVWSQPDRPSLAVKTVSDNPKDFMEALTLRVDNTIVATRSFTTSGGVPVAASVRRRVDGELFSVIVAGGEISDQDEQHAADLEQKLRDELGMEEPQRDRKQLD